ncbi:MULTISPECIES: type I restriction endonuclease subunit R [Bacillus]|uniref:Type I restriction enzyme endonuclease subunit n=1 Tax=Bacillus licheniformis (strain ATCC 14580 / DSM 13 / JCM 2505 / CCUG 7422 / NBRC 12200 / NCIMB 9375 / NCTC 10341 / NRRL NRS-1264 / Gibson 46) TaxID=279010 RepID=Q65MN3_BACLD|nr:MULTISPECIES: HsdR family type I site-specific deoxyribonuclease [Bacillus]AAU22331.1 Type 1 Site Specific deoxyribonuclease protein HsdRI [Bacillus licheniformis DSM 13 = ATCC 14580]AAU39681.1 type 1 restriction endonuclease HsdR [Bacillus licheniformis DSM 13 = ATCC 14580]MBG9698473.1 deoxyribonuclease [Bacillus licheniformis]MBT1252211.1 type I restriction endonuclease subunit R [Bacillus licheniformis]MCR3917270.1 HsdR family type I site-specific deoxyribonuclease [Bacillus licheniformi
MTKIPHKDEAQVERRLIEVLGEGHNQWNYRPDLKSEEDLWQNLRQKITQNNLSEIGEHPITDKEFDTIKTELLSKTQTPFDAARWLKGENGIARITIEREDVSLGSMSLVLYSNQDIGGGISTYEVVHQIAKQKANLDGRDRRFDVTLLINGLPIVQIELKKVSAKDGVFQAFNQIKKYSEEGMFRNNIFSTLQLFVISNEQTTRYFANAMPKDMHKKFVFSWRTKDNRKVENLYEFVKQVLNIPDAHRLIADYTIVSEDQDNKAVIVLKPYQIHAIQALFTSAMKHQSGFVWHATGSGKTLTSFVSTKLLARKAGVDRTIMLIDRKDLDNQTTTEFTKFASEFNTGISSGDAISNSLIVGTGSAKELSDTLQSDANSNTVIITTRQKLEAALRYAQRQEEQKGTQRFKKLLGQHIVFVVDECHRALSAEGMQVIKGFFPNSTWFGFTGTPIFNENKKQAKGQLARTTRDQYGEVLHTYTIKNALDDGAVLGFQVEHEDTIDPTSLNNYIFNQLRQNEKYANLTADEINNIIDQMDGTEKEAYLEPSSFESDDHIQKVIHKIFRPDNAYTKFDFQNGRPQKSAILTTSSIDMAKRYYRAIKEMMKDSDWLTKEFAGHPIRTGRTIEDPDFPRIAITYSIQENEDNSKQIQDEMKEIIKEYNDYYHTAWSIEDIERYNGDINNRLARKKAEFKEFGKQIDLVIVVDRLLTGFDAPTIQTLFVDRNLSYANLIQAFSRTNRTYPGKTKGLVVTFRKPSTMEQNVKNATKLYSQAQEESSLVYPTYDESKKRFKKAHKALTTLVPNPTDIDENTSLETRIEFVKAFQELNNSYEALVTYNDYNDDMKKSPALQEQVKTLEEYIGIYNTVKGSLEDEGNQDGPGPDFSDIEFYGENAVKIYDIDSTYIDRLLETYSANNQNIRDEIENALQKLKKSEIVKGVYRKMLNAIDANEIDAEEDILAVKRSFFTKARDKAIHEFANTWFVEEDELHLSAIQYVIGINSIPNISKINNSGQFDKYKAVHPDAKPLKYRPEIKRQWKKTLDEVIVPLDDELR